MKKLLILIAVLLILVGCTRREEQEKRARPGFETVTTNIVNDHDIILIHYQENYENYKRSVYVVHADGVTIEDWTTDFVIRIVKDESENAVSILREGGTKWVLIFPSLKIAREMLK